MAKEKNLPESGSCQPDATFCRDDRRKQESLCLRENRNETVFVLEGWQNSLAQGKSAKLLVDFHTRHKYLIMSHSTESYRQMGKLVARAGELDIDILYRDYLEMLQQSLRLKASVAKHINVLQHIFGYFKQQLSAAEKQEVLSIFESYRAGQVPLIVPITLLNQYVHKYQQPYLQQQVYLNPHLTELSLRNHD